MAESCRAILALMYPFDFTGFYPSILSSMMPILDLLDSPVGCLIGLTKDTAEDKELQKKLNEMDCVVGRGCSVDLQGSLCVLRDVIGP